MRRAIAAALFVLLSACANHGDCIQGAKNAFRGSGEGAFLALPFVYLGAAICTGITAAGATDVTARRGATPSTTPVPDLADQVSRVFGYAGSAQAASRLPPP